MLVISKKNFNSEPCYACSEKPDKENGWRYSKIVRLYHKPAYQHTCDIVEVCVPHCNKCMKKMEIKSSTIFKIVITCAILTFISRIPLDGFLTSLGLGLAIFCCGFTILYFPLEYANSRIYSKVGEDYKIVKLLIDKYGWQTNKPSPGKLDKSYTKEFINLMCYDLITNYDCKITRHNK